MISLFINNIKPILFAHVELLELIYPTSDSCSQVNNELYTFFDAYNNMIEGPQSS